jgi:hypothetical protein
MKRPLSPAGVRDVALRHILAVLKDKKSDKRHPAFIAFFITHYPLPITHYSLLIIKLSNPLSNNLPQLLIRQNFQF